MITDSPQTLKNLDKIREKFEFKVKTPWLNDLRKENLTRFEKLGIPSTKDEEWKYSNFTDLTKVDFHLLTDSTLIEKDDFKHYVSQEDINVVFVNGVFNSELSNIGQLPEGLTILSLEEAVKTHEEDLRKLYTKYEGEAHTSFIALNNAFTDNGIYIHLDAKKVIEQHIHIVHVTSHANNETVTFPRAFISLEKSSEIVILESFVSFNPQLKFFTNALTDIYIDENATLHYIKAEREGEGAAHVNSTRVWQERSSNLKAFTLTTQSGKIRNNLDIIINGEGADATLYSLYSIFNQQHVDNHTSVDHRVPNCTSNQLYKGILNHESRAVFNGKIFVKPIAQQTNSYQLNKNLMLGDKCRVDTKPQLEIFADDVKCTHGATIGQLEEDEIFYLQTRCIERKAAIKMLARGFADEILADVVQAGIRSKLEYLLKASFEAL